MEQANRSTGDTNREALRLRIDELIRRLLAGEVDSVQALMHDGRWREGLNVSAVDSGRLGYADDLLDEGHSILRQAPTHIEAAIEKLENARGRLM